MNTAQKIKQILITGLVIGTLDGAAASLHTWIKAGRGPEIVFRYVGSGVFGTDAFTGGSGMIWMGLLFHYIIATGWSALYIALYPMIKNTGARAWVIGPLYGVFVWLMMHFAVVPLSNVRPLPGSVEGVIIGLLIHMIVIGLPIAWITQRYDKRLPA